MVNDKRAAILLTIITGILEAIQASGSMGAPSGVIYSALMGVLNLENYTTIIDSLKRKGYVTESNHCLSLTAEGEKFLGSLTCKTS